MSSRRTRDERGAVAVIVAAFVLLGMVLLAFVVDRGRVYVTQAQLQNAVDSASLAAAQTFCGGGGNTVTTAQAYGTNNNVPINAADVSVQPGTMSYVNVRANTTLNLLFGSFVSTNSAVVAAQATAARSCLINYRFVADTNVVFTGNSSDLRQVGIYAGECFYSTGTTNQFGVVAVGTPQADPSNLCHPRDPIDPGGGTVETPIYGLTGPAALSVDEAADLCYLPGCNATPPPGSVTVNQVFDNAQAGIPYAGTTYWTGDCDSNGSPPPTGAGYTLYCNSDFKKMDDVNGGVIVANGDIDLEAGTYSNVLIASIGGKVTLKTGANIQQGVVIYAPGGVTDATGNSSNQLGAYIFSGELKFAGSGVNVPGGVQAYGPGKISLVQ
jgi:Flp pilus assembly protein TadG